MLKKRDITLLLFFLLPMTFFASDLPGGMLGKPSFGFFDIGTHMVLDFDSDIKEMESMLGKSITGITQANTIAWDGIELKLLEKYSYDQKANKFIQIPGSYAIKSITIKKASFSTRDGITIGMSIAKLIEKYGQPYRQSGKYFLYLHYEPEDVWNLVFDIQDGKIVQMRMVRGD